MSAGGYYTINNGNRPAPLISVVTVCYNAADTLSTCIDSVIMQEFEDIEHIIIDGNSTDATLDLLLKRSDQIAFWRSEPDNGIYHAMNKALKYVRGKWIVFLGADDELLPSFSSIAPYLKDPQTLYYANVLYDTVPTGREIDGYFLAKNNICHQSILYPRAVFEKYQFDEKYLLYADHHLNMQCWFDPLFKWQYVDLVTARFATDGASAQKIDVEFEKDKPMLIKKYFGKVAHWRYLFKEFKLKMKG